MINLISYNDYLYEDTSSSVSTFLKAQYNNIFKDPNQQLSNLFTDFTKKVDKEKNISNLYQKYLKANQTTFQNEVNNAETIDAVNKLLTDNIKFFYFSLKPIVNKLQNKEFTIEEIFSKSKDKRLQKLMSYPEDQFSNAAQQYISEGVLPWVKKDAGLEKEPTQQTQQPVSTTERIKYNVYKILEAEQLQPNTDADLLAYKKSAIKWINLSLFDLIKPKIQLLNQLGANISNSVDQLSKQMKGSTNENAKKMILNKIMNMDNEGLKNLANSLGLKEEEIGKL
jgi:hypothetical protein